MSQVRTQSVRISTIMNSRDFKDGYASAVAGKPFDYRRDEGSFDYGRGRLLATWIKAESMAHIKPYRAELAMMEKSALINLFMAANRSGALI